jgi:hypothetical protein
MQTVVQSVAEAMGAVEQCQRAKQDEVHPRNRMAQQGKQMLVAGLREPAQWQSQSEQKEMDGDQ